MKDRAESLLDGFLEQIARATPVTPNSCTPSPRSAAMC